MTTNDENVRAAIAEQASAWFEENRSGPLDPNARARFIDWLRASPVHVQEYLGIAVLAGDLPVAANDPELSPDAILVEAHANVGNVVTLDPTFQRNAPMRPQVRVSRAWSIAAAAAAATIFIVSTAIWSGRDGQRFGLPKTYSTAHGEQSVRQLPDGSVLHLNTDSEVTVRYSRGERVIDVQRGEALFQVAHDTQRRFRVAASAAGVIAVGTQFAVYRRPDVVTVTVVEGTVAVFTGSPPLPSPTNRLPPTVLRIGAGYQVDVRSQVGPPRPVNARAAVAWLQRHVAFDDRPLGEVADEFNRYGRITIEIEDPDLRALPISGDFDAYDADSFAAFLATLEGVVVRKTATRIRVMKQASASREPLPVDH